MSWKVLKSDQVICSPWVLHLIGEDKRRVFEGLVKDQLKRMIDAMTLEEVAGVAPFILYDPGKESEARIEMCIRVNDSGAILAEQYREKAEKIFK